VRIDGARVWITGASSGIGRALARELARRGARVAISARRVERLDQLAAEGAMLPVPVDVTDLASMMQAAARVESDLGAIDLAIFNAGIWEQVNVAAWDSELFRRHFDTNLMGLVHGVEAVLPGMRRRRAGTIAGMASVAGYRGIPRS
jgi:NADP-dependent 3-hydroxy acid dehydrogenase YdfG